MEAKITLSSNQKQTMRQPFELWLTEEQGMLYDPNGELVASFKHENAESRFILPSFWESVKDLGIRGDDGKVYTFIPSTEKVSQIKRYLNTALAIAGPEAARTLRNRGLLHLFIGLGLIALGAIITVVTLGLAVQRGAGSYFIMYGPVIGGIIEVVRGVAMMRRSALVDESSDA